MSSISLNTAPSPRSQLATRPYKPSNLHRFKPISLELYRRMLPDPDFCLDFPNRSIVRVSPTPPSETKELSPETIALPVSQDEPLSLSEVNDKMSALAKTQNIVVPQNSSNPTNLAIKLQHQICHSLVKEGRLLQEKQQQSRCSPKEVSEFFSLADNLNDLMHSFQSGFEKLTVPITISDIYSVLEKSLLMVEKQAAITGKRPLSLEILKKDLERLEEQEKIQILFSSLIKPPQSTNETEPLTSSTNSRWASIQEERANHKEVVMSSISLNTQPFPAPCKPPELIRLLSWNADIVASSKYSDSEKELFSKVCHLFEVHCKGKEALVPYLSYIYSSIEELLENRQKYKPIYRIERLTACQKVLSPQKSVLAPRNPSPTISKQVVSGSSLTVPSQLQILDPVQQEPPKQKEEPLQSGLQMPLVPREDILSIREDCNNHIDNTLTDLRANIYCHDKAKGAVVKEKIELIQKFKLAFDANDLGLDQPQPTISDFKEAVKNLISKYEPKEKQIITEMMQGLHSYRISGGIKFTLIEKEPSDPSLVTEIAVEESAKELCELEESDEELSTLEEPDDNLSELEEYDEDEKIDEYTERE